MLLQFNRLWQTRFSSSVKIFGAPHFGNSKLLQCFFLILFTRCTLWETKRLCNLLPFIKRAIISLTFSCEIGFVMPILLLILYNMFYEREEKKNHKKSPQNTNSQSPTLIWSCLKNCLKKWVYGGTCTFVIPTHNEDTILLNRHVECVNSALGTVQTILGMQ